MSVRNTILAFIVLMNTSLFIGAQPKIVYAEYYFDTDPGLGNGIKIDDPLLDDPGQQSSIIHIKGAIPWSDLDGLADGSYHKLVIRTKDEDENWSVAHIQTFYKGEQTLFDPNAPDIVAYEYFFDEDPGPGQVDGHPTVLGELVTLDAPLESSVKQIIEVSNTIINSLDYGFHTLTVRLQDEKGNWSSSYSRIFRRFQPKASETRNMERVDYQWVVDGNLVGEPVTLLPANNDPVTELNLMPTANLTEKELRDANAVLKVTPYDNSGNQGMSAHANVKINNKDTDLDGFPDYWEDENNFDKTKADDPQKDSDGDGLTDKEEFDNKTKPKKKDSDDDGIDDKAEIVLKEYGFDPVVDDKKKIEEFKEATKNLDLYGEKQAGNIDDESPVLKKDPLTGDTKMEVKIDKTKTLKNADWSKLTVKEEDVDVEDGEVVIKFKDTDDGSFFRTRLGPPPGDSDDDGIPDDVEETWRAFLSPDDPTDVKIDFNCNGLPALEDYQNGDDPFLAGFMLPDTSALPHGHLFFDVGIGYTVLPSPDGKLYAIPDGTAQGGFRFVDAEGMEILMEHPESLNLGYTEDGQYDFRLSSDGSNKPSTDYETFDPITIDGPIPALTSATSTLNYQRSVNGWGGVSVPSAQTIVPSLPDTVWAEDSLNNPSPYLLLRQPISVGEGGVLRQGELIELGGLFVTDTTILIRKPNDTIEVLADMLIQAGGLLTLSFDPFNTLLPGTNFLEIYSSYAVASPNELYEAEDEFEDYLLGDLFYLEAGIAVNATTSWTITDSSGSAFAGNTPNSPTLFNQILAHGSNDNGYVLWGDYLGYPDAIYDFEFGVPATDNDRLNLWFEVTQYDSAQILEGYYFFITSGEGGGAIAGPEGATVGLAHRNGDGTTTLIASDLDTPALADWHSNHGHRGDTAEHWNIEIETIGDRIRVSASDRGLPNSSSGPPTHLLVDVVDPFFSQHYGYLSGRFGVESISQQCWIGSVEVRQTSFKGRLRIDEGMSNENGIQSLDAMTVVPRYYVADGQIFDRMGDGEPTSNANPYMTSKIQNNYIDYVPSTPLLVAPAGDYFPECLTP